MTHNPFHNTLDWAVQGKYVEVEANGDTYRGWLDRVHHQQGSVVLHDTIVNGDTDRGSVFIRTPNVIEVIKPKKRIEHRQLTSLTPHPNHEMDFTPKDDIIQSCYRNQYAKSFPVVTEEGTIINGHKRIAAAKIAGMDKHPVEVINVTTEQATELFALAHGDTDQTSPTDSSNTDEKNDEAGPEQPTVTELKEQDIIKSELSGEHE